MMNSFFPFKFIYILLMRLFYDRDDQQQIQHLFLRWNWISKNISS